MAEETKSLAIIKRWENLSLPSKKNNWPSFKIKLPAVGVKINRGKHLPERAGFSNTEVSLERNRKG